MDSQLTSILFPPMIFSFDTLIIAANDWNEGMNMSMEWV